MNNNNNIMLPLYIQKFIIKILCNHINRNNKIIDIPAEIKDYRYNENEINQLTLSISLVNKSWFNTIQFNLNVSIDLNHNEDNNNNNNKYSILKLENIKTLKLHYCHEKDQFYNLIDKIQIPIPIEEINNSLKILSNSNNFKRLIFRNINIANNNNLELCLNQLYKCNVTENNLELLKIEINKDTKIENLIKLNNKVKKLYSILFNYKSFVPYLMTNVEIKADFILQVFKIWYLKQLKQLYIYSKSFYLPIFQLLSGETIEYYNSNNQFIKIESAGKDRINYLKNIEVIELFSSEITIDEILCLVNSNLLQNLNKLIFEICFEKLNYFLSTPLERIENKIHNCTCNSIIFTQNGNDNNVGGTGGGFGLDEEEQVIFNEKWKLLLEFAKSNKLLNLLKVKHHCKTRGARLIWQSNKFSKSYINGLCEFVYSFKSLTKFAIVGPIPPSIYNEIISNNKSIIHFESKINIAGSLSSENYYNVFLDEINRLTSNTNQIKSYKLIRMDYANANYTEHVLLDYNN